MFGDYSTNYHYEMQPTFNPDWIIVNKNFIIKPDYRTQGCMGTIIGSRGSSKSYSEAKIARGKKNAIVIDPKGDMWETCIKQQGYEADFNFLKFTSGTNSPNRIYFKSILPTAVFDIFNIKNTRESKAYTAMSKVLNDKNKNSYADLRRELKKLKLIDILSEFDMMFTDKENKRTVYLDRLNKGRWLIDVSEVYRQSESFLTPTILSTVYQYRVKKKLNWRNLIFIMVDECQYYAKRNARAAKIIGAMFSKGRSYGISAWICGGDLGDLEGNIKKQPNYSFVGKITGKKLIKAVNDNLTGVELIDSDFNYLPPYHFFVYNQQRTSIRQELIPKEEFTDFFLEVLEGKKNIEDIAPLFALPTYENINLSIQTL